MSQFQPLAVSGEDDGVVALTTSPPRREFMPTVDEVDTLSSAAELFQHHAEVKRLVGKLNADKAWKKF